MSNPFEPDLNWERVAAELRAGRDAQKAAWGSIDNATLGRYLADEVTGAERQEIEEALHNLPELRMLTDLVRDVLTEFEPVAVPVPAAAPVTLSFAQHAASRPAKRKSYFGKTFRQRAALAAAACLLLGLGLALQGLNQPAETRYSLGSPSASRIQLARLDRLDREVEDLQSKGRIPEAMDRASQLPVVAKQAHLDEDPRFARSLNRAGMLYQDHGQLALAQENYTWAYGICQKKLGEEHPATVQSLANAYQADINQAPPLAGGYGTRGQPHQVMAKTNFPPARTEDKAKNQKWASRKTDGLAGRPILRQNPREVQQAVVPVLVQALQQAETSRERLAYISALGRLGPAARGAVPSLTLRLNESKDVAERQAILVAMGEMGPSADNALPVLVQSLKSSEPLVRQAADQSLRRAYGSEELLTLTKTSGQVDGKGRVKAYQEACVAMRDCDLFSVEAVVESERDLLALAQNNGPVLYVTTMTTGEGKDVALADRDVRKLLEVEGVLLAMSREGRVTLRVPGALQQRGFTLNKQSELLALLEKHLKERDYDAALRESIQFVSKLDLGANQKRK